MEIEFDHIPILKSAASNGLGAEENGDSEDGEVIMGDIAGRDIGDDLVVEHLLKMDEMRWEFVNEETAAYRLQSNRLDHALMLPHPRTMYFF